MPLVSVVIPSYNSAKHIRQCLRALRAQSTKLPFEVILVDSSVDGTDHIVTEEFPEIRLFHFQDRRSVGVARNIGIEKTQGEVVLFLDTDCIVGPLWIDQMYTAIQRFGVDGVCGSVNNGTPWSITGSVGFYLEFFRFLAYNGEPYTTQFLIGCNCGFRKEAIRTARYYDQYSDERVGEDFIYSWQLTKKGKKLLFLPSVAVNHMNRTGLLTIWRYQYTFGLGACSYRHHVSPEILRFLGKFPALVFLMPVAVMPWIGYLVLRRRGILEFIKFAALLPLLFISNSVWAMGFYRELIHQKNIRLNRIPDEYH